MTIHPLNIGFYTIIACAIRCVYSLIGLKNTPEKLIHCLGSFLKSRVRVYVCEGFFAMFTIGCPVGMVMVVYVFSR